MKKGFGLKFSSLLLSVSLITSTLMPVKIFAAENNAVKLTKDQIYSGFKVLDTKNIKEINSNVYIMKHVQTGAQLIYLQNDDPNKAFTISFATPTVDCTGVNHIIEHTTLCGSKKYQIKDPFKAIGKQSLKTFLNAETSIDMTKYPIASRNDKDFRNLMNIYLDAVFYPNFYNEPKIFKQEGWRYELDSKDGELKYNGIVYNEMKGALSETSKALYVAKKQTLFPDTAYGYESGGIPEVIPSLTYEKYVKTHKKYYHPSNSYIYLYGNLDILDTLKFINDDYLSKFNEKKIDVKVPYQKPFDKRVERTYEYSVPNGTNLNNKTYLDLAYVVNDIDYVSLYVLLDALLADSSPLKKALSDAKIAGKIDAGIAVQPQTIIDIKLSNSNEESKDKFLKIVDETLQKMAKEGIDKNLLKSAIDSNSLSFKNSNVAADRGVEYRSDIMKGYLYYNDPTKYLQKESVLEDLRKKMDKGYFDELLKTCLLNNNHSALIILKPKCGLDDEKSAKLKDELAKYKASLSDEQLEKLISDTKAFKAWQAEPNTKEAISTIPTLTLNDIENKAEKYPLEEKTVNDTKVLNHPIFTNNLAYVNMYFDSTTIPQNKLPYLFLLTDLLGAVDTSKYSYDKLTSIIGETTSTFSITSDNYTKCGDDSMYYPKVNVKLATSIDKLPTSMSLASEVITNSKFDNKARTKELITQIKSSLQGKLTSSRDLLDFIDIRTRSYISPSNAYLDQKYINYYNFLCDVEQNFDSRWNDLSSELNNTSKILFNKDSLLVSFTGDKDNYSKFEQNLKNLLGALKSDKLPRYSYNFNTELKNEGLIVPGSVQYVAKSVNYKNSNFKFNGNMYVMKNIVNQYLYDEIRVKKGAYGAYNSISPNGSYSFYSYRDPSLKETLDTYDKTEDFLRNFKASDKDMVNYIIGSMSSVDPLTAPKEKGERSDMEYISGITQEYKQKIRDQLLNTKVEDINKYADLIKALKEKNNITVAGSQEKINANKDLFKNVYDILKVK